MRGGAGRRGALGSVGVGSRPAVEEDAEAVVVNLHLERGEPPVEEHVDAPPEESPVHRDRVRLHVEGRGKEPPVRVSAGCRTDRQ